MSRLSELAQTMRDILARETEQNASYPEEKNAVRDGLLALLPSLFELPEDDLSAAYENEDFIYLSDLFGADIQASMGISPLIGSGETGARSATTGTGDVWLGGTYMEVGIAKNGSFGTSFSRPTSPTFHPAMSDRGLGMVSSHDGTVWNSLTTDYFMPGTIDESFSIGWNNQLQFVICDYGSTGGKVNPTGGKTVDESSGDTLQATTTFTQSGVAYSQTVSFNKDDKYFTTTVTVTNTTSATMPGFRYMRAFDPDQKSGKTGGSTLTNNVVGHSSLNEYGTSVIAYGLNDTESTPFIFFSADKRAVAGYTTSGLCFNDLFNAYNSMVTTPGSHLFADKDIFIYCDFGDLDAGETDSFTYISSLDTDLSSALGAIIALNKDNFVSGRGDGSTDTPSMNKYYVTVLKTLSKYEYALVDGSGDVVPGCDWAAGDDQKRVYGPFDGNESSYTVKVRLVSDPSNFVDMGPFDCPTVPNVYQIIGRVLQADASGGTTPISGAVVQAMNGQQEFTSTDSAADGTFTLTNVENGKYNLVVTTPAGKVQTLAINSDTDLNAGDIVFPANTVNTQVEVADGAPNTVVTTLDQIPTDPVPDGDTSIILTVSSAGTSSLGGTLISSLLSAAHKTGSLYLDLSLEKVITGGASAGTTVIPETDQLMELIFDLPTDAAGKQNYVIYRHHDANQDGVATAGEIDKITLTPNAQGEYFTLSGNRLSLFVKYFSTYTIAYDEPGYLQPAPDVSIQYADEKLTGYDKSLMEYSVDGGATYLTALDLSDSLTSLIPAAGDPDLTLLVRIPEDSANGQSASAVKTLTVAARPVAAAPAAAQVTENSLTLVGVSGAKYAVKKSGASAFSAWQDSPVFTGLTKNTTYLFKLYLPATAALFSSAESGTLTVTTGLGIPTGLSVDYSAELLAGYNPATMEYSTDGGVSYTGAENLSISLSSLIPAAGQSDISLWVRAKADAAHNLLASNPSVISLPARPQAPAPQLAGCTNNRVQLVQTQGTEYAIQSDQSLSFGSWQDSAVFSNLAEATKYQLKARTKSTAGTFASEDSEIISVTTARSSVTEFYIHAVAGKGGQFSTGEYVSARIDESAGFAILPDAGYEIADVTVNGVSVGPVSWYEFTHILSNQTISATFRKISASGTQTGGSSTGSDKSQTSAQTPSDGGSSAQEDLQSFRRALNNLRKSDISYDWLPDIKANQTAVQTLVDRAAKVSKADFDALSDEDRQDALGYANALMQLLNLPEMTREELFPAAFSTASAGDASGSSQSTQTVPSQSAPPDSSSEAADSTVTPVADEKKKGFWKSLRSWWWLLLVLAAALIYKKFRESKQKPKQ